jgi:hypothetical protein
MDERLRKIVKEKDNMLKSLEVKILNVESKWMRGLSRYEGVITNNTLRTRTETKGARIAQGD